MFWENSPLWIEEKTFLKTKPIKAICLHWMSFSFSVNKANIKIFTSFRFPSFSSLTSNIRTETMWNVNWKPVDFLPDHSRWPSSLTWYLSGKEVRPGQNVGTVALIISMMSESLNYRKIFLYLDTYRTLMPAIQHQSQIIQFLRDSLHYQVLW